MDLKSFLVTSLFSVSCFKVSISIFSEISGISLLIALNLLDSSNFDNTSSGHFPPNTFKTALIGQSVLYSIPIFQLYTNLKECVL